MKYIPLLFFFFLSIAGNAQQDLFIGSSFMAGIPINSYENEGKILNARLESSTLGGTIFGQYRLFDRFGIEAGLIQGVQKLRLNDEKFPGRNPGFEVKLSSTNSYWSYYGALSYAHPITPKSKIYSTLGYIINNSGSNDLSKTKNFIITGEDVTFKSTYKNKNAAIYLEAGIECMTTKHLALFFAFRFNKGLSSLTEGEYIVEKNGEVLTNDRFRTFGSFVGINTGLKIKLFHKDKTIRQPKPSPVIVPKEVAPIQNKKIEGRQLIVTNRVTVKSATVTILVWDDQKVDGDRVSLNLNGQWILQNYTLEKTKRSIIATLSPGENTFVLHALNLGEIKPNTAALMIDDGITKQKLLLESDLESSGTLIIQYIK